VSASAATIAEELGLKVHGVAAVLALVDEGSTVPFIARYRKEASGGLDEVQIRAIVERHVYLSELCERRAAVLAELDRQGVLTLELKRGIERAASKAALEDLYAPYKPKRRTRGVMARERCLEPLANRIWQQPHDGSPERDARAFVDAAKGVPDVEAALAGARDICAERIADQAPVRQRVRDVVGRHGAISVRKTKTKKQERTKFDDYADHHEAIARIPSHRWLAIRRGESERVLKVSIDVDDQERLRADLQRDVRVEARSPWAGQLRMTIAEALSRLLLPRAVSQHRAELDQRAERDAVGVFAKNLRQLLLASPYGTKPVLGIDPGQRTGCKCAAVSSTGELRAHDTIFLVQGDSALAAARRVVVDMCRSHRIAAVAVGNGTHGRETEAFVRETLRDAGVEALVVSVSEAGASVYSASDIARQELGDVDLTVRGAVSIARRLQDPLAELVKVDPESIGVGQYQHDVAQPLLAAKVDEVVEDCVNAVGVELNTASAPLLARVAGLGPTLAKRVVAHRAAHGAFRSRRELLAVNGLGPKAFEQAAGFLRLLGGAHPLDASAVHPERYALVEQMARDIGVALPQLIGNDAAIARIDRARYQAGDIGRFTVDDILAELHKPGRDPRAAFEAPAFRDDVRTLADLSTGMQLEGVVTNVTDFGAFVDIGVKQDGLVHVSKLARRFVRHPSDVVAVGDRLHVRVDAVDLERKRISLDARADPD
jgi:uncharacterized protein